MLLVCMNSENSKVAKLDAVIQKERKQLLFLNRQRVIRLQEKPDSDVEMVREKIAKAKELGECL